MKKLLHIAAKEPHPVIWTRVFREALKEIGELTIVENGDALSEDRRAELVRGCNILLTGWAGSAVPVSIAKNRGKLEYICNITGEVKQWISLDIIEAGIPVTNWGDVPAVWVAQGAMTLLLATLKDLHHRIELVRRDGWKPDVHTHGGALEGLNVGIYGLGVIGRQFVELLRPFDAVMRVYDPYTKDLPPGCMRVNSLDELFEKSRAIVIHAALTDETRGSVTAGLLAKLPKYGVVINTARGGIIDQAALFAELKSGRLRAGLDVLEPDSLPPGHPARKWENCIFSSHTISNIWPDDNREPQELDKQQKVCMDNLRRHVKKQPLRFVMDRTRYLRST